jgi:hypothetical protein
MDELNIEITSKAASTENQQRRKRQSNWEFP